MSGIDTMISRLTDRQGHAFALACARRVQHLMRDPRSVAALDTRERWLRGEATDKEMAAARDAAWDAVWDARHAAEVFAWAAALAAAWSAAWSAARAVASAARDAASAARDAAGGAERAWQRAELERMLAEGGGA